MKRLLAIFLSLTMLVSAAPLSALAASDNSLSQTITVQSQPDADLVQAIASDPFLTAQADSAPVQEQNATVDTSNVSMEATNSFGKLLLDGMDLDGENGSNFSSGNRVIGITMNGSTATVKYVAEEDADLVVGIYTDDSEEQMVASGTVAVDKTTDGTVKVAIVGEIPDYYIIKGYLFDKAEHAPLCEAFTNTSNTKDMVDLAGATVNDFPEDRVINLDDDATTNFVVVNQDVTLLTREDSAAGKNNIVSQDDDGLNYTIANASAEIKNLQVGDILTYEYAPGELLVVKVASIAVNGDTVTIHGDDTLEVTDVFDALKIETDADTSKFEFGTEEGFTDCGEVELDDSLFEGESDFVIEDESFIEAEETNGLDANVGVIIGRQYSILIEGEKNQPGKASKVEGTLGIFAEATLGYYISNQSQSVTFKLNPKMTLNIDTSGKIEKSLWTLPSFGVSPVMGVYIDCEPTLKLTIGGKTHMNASLSAQIGVGYSSDLNEFTNLSKLPVVKVSSNLQVSISLGVDFAPKVKILGFVAEVKMKSEIGVRVEVTANTRDIDSSTDRETVHDCSICYNGTVSVYLDAGVILIFLNREKQSIRKDDLVSLSAQVGDFYYSMDHKKFGWGSSCPYTAYRVIVSIDGVAQEGFVIGRQADDGSLSTVGITDKNGTVTLYLAPGNYTLSATVGEEKYKNSFIVQNQPLNVVLKIDGSEVVDPEIPTGGRVVASGTCGKDGDNLKWVLDNKGILTISGEGEMENYQGYGIGYDSAPWDSEQVKNEINSVLIKSGVTSIGEYAFGGCDNLTSVEIPSSVTSIGKRAFLGCMSLIRVTIPFNVARIEEGTFCDCASLIAIIIPTSVTHIGGYAFLRCKSLTTIMIPPSVTNIGDWAFKGCSLLTNISIASSVTSIGESVFSNCTSLTSIEIPSSVTYIGDYAFEQCTSLTSIELPSSIKSIEKGTFSDCTGLRSVAIPPSVTMIDAFAFEDCTSLTNVEIPFGVKRISTCAFGNCTALTSITIPSSVTEIDWVAFEKCTSLTNIEIPASVRYINRSTFSNCTNLKSVTIPSSVSEIRDYAFSDCTSLMDVTIPANIRWIEEGVFLNCTSLRNVTIPSKVEYIENYAFKGCTSLTSITIPISVKTIDNEAFNDNEAKIYYDGTKEQWKAIKLPTGINDRVLTTTIYCSDGNVEPETENSITTGKTDTSGNTLHAVFNGLTAGEDYAVIVSKSAENPLDAGNLIYINQKTAGANGVLDVPFVSSESGAAYVVACRKGGSTNPGGNTGKDDSSTSKPGDDTTKPSTPEKPANSGGGGGAIVAVVLIGGAAAAVTAGVILMMPVEVSGVAQLGDGNVLANANVQLMKDGQQVAQTTTDESGHFALEVKRGEYQMNVTTVNPETGEQTVRTASVKAPAKNGTFTF